MKDFWKSVYVDEIMTESCMFCSYFETMYYTVSWTHDGATLWWCVGGREVEGLGVGAVCRSTLGRRHTVHDH